jgi:hypothetical protein
MLAIVDWREPRLVRRTAALKERRLWLFPWRGRRRTLRTNRAARRNIGRHSENQQPSPKAGAIPIRVGPERRERISGLAFDDSDLGLCFLFAGASGCRYNLYDHGSYGGRDNRYQHRRHVGEIIGRGVDAPISQRSSRPSCLSDREAKNSRIRNAVDNHQVVVGMITREQTRCAIEQSLVEIVPLGWDEIRPPMLCLDAGPRCGIMR